MSKFLGSAFLKAKHFAAKYLSAASESVGRRFRVRNRDKKREFETLAEFKRWLANEEEEFTEQATKAIRNPRLIARPKPVELPPIVIEDATAEIVSKLQAVIDEHNERLENIWIALIKRQAEINEDEEILLCLMA